MNSPPPALVYSEAARRLEQGDLVPDVERYLVEQGFDSKVAELATNTWLENRMKTAQNSRDHMSGNCDCQGLHWRERVGLMAFCLTFVSLVSEPKHDVLAWIWLVLGVGSFLAMMIEFILAYFEWRNTPDTI